MPADTPCQSIGRRGEELAADFLRRQGYRIRETNARCRLGEIDIVADTPGDGEKLLVFIEVKTRRGAAFGSPLEAVTISKQQRLTRLAQAYLQQNPRLSERVCRFDVIGIVIPREGEPSIDHIPSAF
jgi:putative endonuclease